MSLFGNLLRQSAIEALAHEFDGIAAEPIAGRVLRLKVSRQRYVILLLQAVEQAELPMFWLPTVVEVEAAAGC